MNSPTVDSEGNFKYEDGSEWGPYIEYTTFQGEEVRSPDHTRMAAELLLNEVMFINSRHYMVDSYSPPRTLEVSTDATLVCFVICNDTFAYACADAESVSLQELPRLYDMWKTSPLWGSTQWCALKRKQRPLPQLVDRMKAAGVWTEELEKL